MLVPLTDYIPYIILHHVQMQERDCFDLPRSFNVTHLGFLASFLGTVTHLFI